MPRKPLGDGLSKILLVHVNRQVPVIGDPKGVLAIGIGEQIHTTRGPYRGLWRTDGDPVFLLEQQRRRLPDSLEGKDEPQNCPVTLGNGQAVAVRQLFESSEGGLRVRKSLL
jgi:hypothetical protein